MTTNLDYADGKWWGAEAQVTKSFLQRNRLTAGSEFRDNLRQDQTNLNLNPASLLLDDRRSSLVSGVYVQDEVTISNAVTLNGGFRYDYYNRMDASVDPRAALVYRPSSQSAFKVIFGESFRIPNVYELYYSILPNVANPLLKPEKVRTTEVVWEQTVRNRLWFSTSAFFNDIDDLVTEVQNNDGSLMFQNMQDANSTGIEVQTKVQWPKGLESTASYSFQKTWDESTGRSLSNSPRSLIKLNLSQPLAKKHLFLSLDAQYRSRVEVLGGGSISPSTVVNATFLTRNLHKRLNLSASIYSLFDTKYFDPPSSANLNLPIQQDGRSFRVKLTWHPGER